MVGRTVCHMHGGKSLGGIASPRLTTGKYSRYLPARLSERYQESLSDPELLALREEVALVDSRLADLLSRVDSGESGHLWQLLKDTHAEMLEARSMGDTRLMGVKLGVLGKLIQEGLADYAAWEDVRRVLEQRRKLVESERKRLVEMQQVLTTERAMVLVHALAETVKKHVSDRGTLAAISADLSRILLADASRANSA